MKKVTIITILAVLLIVGVGVYWWLKSVPLPEKTYVVGVISYGGAHNQAIEGMKEEMAQLGYVEGEQISYIIVDAGGSLEQVKQASQMFVEEGADAVYSITTPITREVMRVVREVPVVFNIVSDPVGAGIVQNWLSSGNNAAGCSNYVGQTGPKRLEVLLDILPQTKTVLVLYDPNNAFSQDAILILRQAAADQGVTLAEELVSSKEEVISSLERLQPGQYDAFFHLGEALVSGAAAEVVPLVNSKKLASVAHAESFAERGMLVTYGPSWHFLGRQCARVLDEVLQGTKPSQIPIQIPAKMNLVINLSTARQLNIEIPEEILLRADRLIEESR